MTKWSIGRWIARYVLRHIGREVLRRIDALFEKHGDLILQADALKKQAEEKLRQAAALKREIELWQARHPFQVATDDIPYDHPSER